MKIDLAVCPRGGMLAECDECDQRHDCECRGCADIKKCMQDAVENRMAHLVSITRIGYYLEDETLTVQDLRERLFEEYTVAFSLVPHEYEYAFPAIASEYRALEAGGETVYPGMPWWLARMIAEATEGTVGHRR